MDGAKIGTLKGEVRKMRKEEEPIPLSQEIKNPPLPEVHSQGPGDRKERHGRNFRHEEGH